MDILTDFFASAAGLAAKGMLVAAFLDLAFGVYAAVKDNTFAWDSLASFVRKHLLGRVFPISTLLAVGYFIDGGEIMTAAGVAAATAYAAETLASIYGSLKPPTDVETVDEWVDPNPVPID